jgi:ribonuclease HI
MPLMPLLGAKAYAYLDPFIEEWLLGEPFSDGACSNQGTDFARVGIGIHYYPKCSRNVALPLEGNYQGSDRAELKAAVLSLERHRWGKILITTDNTMVSEGIQVVTYYLQGKGTRPLYNTNRDLWQKSIIETRRIGPANVKCKWTKGHASQESVDKGWISQASKDGNDFADDLAVKGRKAHGYSYSTKTDCQDAQRRKDITMIVQNFMIEI